MSDDRITSHGKEILMDGHHLADARDDEAAQVIAIALSRCGLAGHRWPPEELAVLESFFA